MHAIERRHPQMPELPLVVDRLPTVWLLVDVPQSAIGEPFCLHPRRVKRHHVRDRAAGVANHLAVGVAVEQVEHDQLLTQLEARLLVVGSVPQDAKQRRFGREHLGTGRIEPVEVQRQAADALSNHANARDDRWHLGSGLWRLATHAARAGKGCKIKRPQLADAVLVTVADDFDCAHSVRMFQSASGGGVSAAASTAIAVTRAAIPSIRSVLLALLGLIFPW